MTPWPALIDIDERPHGRAHRPWPRVVVDERRLALAIEPAGERPLDAARPVGRYAAPCTWRCSTRRRPRSPSSRFDCPQGTFPSVGALHPPAIRLERAIRDLFGLEPVGRARHAALARSRPLGRAPSARRRPSAASAERLCLPAGRRRGPAPDPGRPGACRHHRARPFPLHRQRRDRGAAGRAARLRPQGHRVADGRRAARAGGAARRRASRATAPSPMRSPSPAPSKRRSASRCPPRAVWLRALMAELERLANHFGDIGAICNDASFALMHAHCGILRERVLRAARRLLRPSADDGPHRARRRRRRSRRGRHRAAPRTGRRHPHGVSPSSSSSTTTPPRCRTAPSAPASCQPELARAVRRRRLCRPRLGPRASMRAARSPIRPTTSCSSRCRCCEEGDVNARVWIRIREVEQSLALIEQILDAAAGRADCARRARAPASVARRPGAGRGLPRRHPRWVRHRRRRPRSTRCHLRDPSWFQWPLLEAVIEGNIVADFPLCNKSFNCSYSGHDL